MSNKSRRLYVGFTDNMVGRTVEHKEKFFPNSFTAHYVFAMLVYYEEYSSVIRAKMKDAREGNQGLAPGKEAEIDSVPEPRLG
jgi:predicted GIY-YIG superfamily endonuclease